MKAKGSKFKKILKNSFLFFLVTLLILIVGIICVFQIDNMKRFNYIEKSYQYAIKEVGSDFKIRKYKAYDNHQYYYICSNEYDIFLEKGLEFLYYLDSKTDSDYSIIIGDSEEPIKKIRCNRYYNFLIIRTNIFGNYDNMYLFKDCKVIIDAEFFTSEQVSEIKEEYPDFEVRT